MSNEAELEEKFWKALKSDMTFMLGLSGVEDDHSQPMTAQFDEDRGQGAIWIFSSNDVNLVKEIGDGHRAFGAFVSKDHEIFASLQGELVIDNDREMIERLWNRFVAAWYPGGKDDPKLRLLRFEPERAQIWLNENSVFSGIKLLLGRDPKKDYKEKVADVRMN